MNGQLSILILLIFSLTIASFGQSQDSSKSNRQTVVAAHDCHTPFGKRFHTEIQEIAIGDSILVKEIKSLIADREKQNEMFRAGKGYIYAILTNSNETNVARRYYINIGFTALKPERNPKAYLAYPHFYSMVNGRLVFLEIENFDRMTCKSFTRKSMRKLRRIQSRFLEETRRSDFYDTSGKKVFTDPNFRIDYSHPHGGRYVTVYSDEKYEVTHN
jgi:hypothetical protein